VTAAPVDLLRYPDAWSAKRLLRKQFHVAHALLDDAIDRLPIEAVHRCAFGTNVSSGVRYAQVVLCEDLSVNGVLAAGTPLVFSTWAGRTGLNEMPPIIGTPDWRAWAHRVRLDLAQLRPYARAVYASTDAYIAALPQDAFNPARGDRSACLLSALLLTLSMRTGEISCLLALERGPTINDDGVGHAHPSVTQ
jgi:hypothetical protein